MSTSPNNKDKRRKHGHSSPTTRAYRIWNGMKTRCSNPRAQFFARYGGRGIKVCDRWKEFENFFADMGDPPAGATLDRINNDGNYELGNCRWATISQNLNNKSTTVFLTFNGKTQSATQWAREIGTTRFRILKRISRDGMSAHEALTRPLRKYPRYGKEGAQKDLS